MLPRNSSDVLKIFAYVAATLLLAAVISPWLYQGGKGLAEVFAEKQGNGPLKYLASAAGRADFPKFFDRSLLISALVLLFPLTAWLRLGGDAVRHRDTPWSLRLPDHAVALDRGQPLRRNPRGPLEFLTGAILAAGLLLVSGWVLVQAGAFLWRDAPVSTRGYVNRFPQAIDWVRAVKGVLPGAAVVAIVEEVLFRGILFGIFLRAVRTAPAIALLSFLFAFVHFLQPPPSARVTDPESLRAGFELLGLIFSRFAEPLPLVSGFVLLTGVGVVLAYARLRTASLWLPAGLHFGWVVGNGLFKAATWPVADLPVSARWFVGMSLREGLVPLSVVVMTGMLVHFMTRVPEEPASYRR